MTTFPPAATAQVDDPSLGPAELLALSAAGPGHLEAAVAGLTADQLRARPIAGKWSTLEVVCHLADTEQFFADRTKRTLAMDWLWSP